MANENERMRYALMQAEAYVLWCMGERPTDEAVQPERVLAVIRGALAPQHVSATSNNCENEMYRNATRVPGYDPDCPACGEGFGCARHEDESQDVKKETKQV